MKEKIHIACLNLIQQKIDELQSALNSAQEAGNSETKSSAGDKHETARAMMQLEQEKLSKQLNEALEQRSELDKIDLHLVSSSIRKGCLVTTDKGLFYLSIGLGKLNLENEVVFVISPQSPLGKEFTGLKRDQTASINNVNYFVKDFI